jgi:beta-1,4-mannooligosaccharide/beta-1,4-mannosyl-N-acetylglucosamine phosphorylase
VSIILFKPVRSAETRVARSKDGIYFTLEEEPFIKLDTDRFPYNIINQHVIDNRVTLIDDTYYILTPLGTCEFDGPATLLGKTKDFKTYEPVEVITLPQNRGASLFSEKINGKYYKLDRPGGGAGSCGPIWLSSSFDLIHWGEFRPVLRPYNSWNWSKIGPTPPIKTEQGWLVIIHGVVAPCDGTHYSIGAMLLDLENPWKVIGKTYSTLLTPEMDYETRGRVDNVVFPCGAIADHARDELKLYYGGADTRVCLATGSLSEVVNACAENI